MHTDRTRPRTALVAALLVAAMGTPAVSRAQPPVTGAAPQTTTDTMRLAAPLRTARAAMSAAYTSLDATRAAGFFTDSAVVDFQGQVYSGRQAISGWLTGAMQGVSALRFGSPTFVVSESEVTERASYTVSLSDGGEQAGTSESTWRRQADGSWKVVRLTVS